MDSAADQRAEMLERWDRAAAGWSRRADSIQEFGMRVSVWMVEQLALQPGQRVLELACGPGDTGFLAAELVRPGGSLIASDASRAMLGVASGRARDLGVTNVEFRQLELEWIDLDTASVDALLCRWGLMFAVDPSAALQEMRRVIVPQGRAAVAVWDDPGANPWAAIPSRALVELGHMVPPDPDAPGMFVLADRDRLQRLLEDAGFLEVRIDAVELVRADAGVADFLQNTLDLSGQFAEVWQRLSDRHRDELRERITALAAPFTAEDGSLRFPARSLVAAASA
jgi:ubiquinone/menaquinone biosynthesis C-methylase UbiE